MTKKKLTAIMLLITLYMGLINSPTHDGYKVRPLNLFEDEKNY